MSTDAGTFTNLDAPKNAKTRYFKHARDDWALSNGFPFRLISQHEGEGAAIKFGKTRAYVAIDEDANGKPVTETWKISGLKFWNNNPNKKTAVKTTAKRAPVKTGVRRVALVGVNPAAKTLRKNNPRPKALEELYWLVRVLNTSKEWVTIAAFMLQRDALKWGQDYANKYPKKTVGVDEMEWL